MIAFSVINFQVKKCIAHAWWRACLMGGWAFVPLPPLYWRKTRNKMCQLYKNLQGWILLVVVGFVFSHDKSKLKVKNMYIMFLKKKYYGIWENVPNDELKSLTFIHLIPPIPRVHIHFLDLIPIPWNNAQLFNTAQGLISFLLDCLIWFLP